MEHPEHQAPKPVIILVEPQLGENIGMVARAMANFGLAELRLVNPRDGWPNDKARAAASKADHVIDATAVFADLASAVADLNFVLATTARERDGFKPVRAPVEAARALRARGEGGQRTGILFGRERFGLFNEEIALADEIVTFPVNPAFASLNIAQAVLLMSYEWMKSGLETRNADGVCRSARKRAGREAASAELSWPPRAGAVGARLFPPCRKEAEDARQSQRRADATGLQRSRDQGAARRACFARLFLAERAARHGLSRTQARGGCKAARRGRRAEAAQACRGQEGRR